MPRKHAVIEWIGGNCPVQAEGRIRGRKFYFRARGDRWSIGIGGKDVVCDPDWYMEEKYGTWPEAGWMTQDEAVIFIEKAAKKYISENIKTNHTERKYKK